MYHSLQKSHIISDLTPSLNPKKTVLVHIILKQGPFKINVQKLSIKTEWNEKYGQRGTLQNYLVIGHFS